MVTLQDLRDEFARDRIGPLILADLQAIVIGVVNGYNPRVYAAGSERWDEEAIDDFLHDFVEHSLLQDGQLDYAMDVASDLRHYHHLLMRQMARTLSRRRVRSVIDNLLDRCRPMLEAPPYEADHALGFRSYALAGSGAESRLPTDAELAKAALELTAVPISLPGGGERAPILYSTRNLGIILGGLASALPCRFSEGDLDRVFRRLLTPWIPSRLTSDETVPAVADHELNPEEILEVQENANRIFEALDGERRHLLRLKYAGATDADIAAQLRVSRPTVIKRREATFEVLRTALEGSSDRVKDATVHELGWMLAAADSAR